MEHAQPHGDVHIPKTRQGGIFTNAKDVNLHANDFGWDDVMASLSAERAALVRQYLQMCEAGLLLCGQPHDAAGAEATSCVAAPKGGKAWESHFSASQHHFPLKNYIIHAFPTLKNFLSAEATNGAVLECGCGTGSTLLPLMRECQNDSTVFVGFDVSTSAVTHFSQHPIAQEMSAKGRLVTFAHDITNEPLPRDEPREPCAKKAKMEADLAVREKLAVMNPKLVELKYDAILLVFVLCALPSVDSMLAALKSLAGMLKPTGVLLFRDYALPDHNFFRFLDKRGNKLEALFFQKGDGTSQFFFERAFTAQLFARAGLVEDETDGLTYHCNRIENRKNGKRMDKIFINGTFRLAPLTATSH